jgi:hypothetical protein
MYSLDAAMYRETMQSVVRAGDFVGAGRRLRKGMAGAAQPLAGTVRVADAKQGSFSLPRVRRLSGAALPVTDKKELPAYLRAMGLVGMGGGRFRMDGVWRAFWMRRRIRW